MTKRKNVFRLFTVLCALFSLTLVACDGGEDKPKDNGDIELSIITSETTIEVGETLQLEYNVSPSDAVVTFKSSDPDIAAVSAISGLITGNSKGATTITATASCSGYNNATASVDITVTEEETTTEEESVTITLKASTTTLKVGESVNVTATCNPSSARVSYSSSDESIATISSTGKVTGVSEGVATITATATRSGYKDGVATLDITVESAYDAAYVIAGDFEGDSWSKYPSNEDLYLWYDSSDQSTQHWKKTVTVSSNSETWSAGFRIIQYDFEYDENDEEVWTTVADYSNLSSRSTGVKTTETNTDNNILFDSWNTTYYLEIDFREGVTSDSIYVSTTPIYDDGYLDLPDDYIMGADISSVIEMEEAGGKVYGWDGKETDVITMLADNGFNYARIRLWNDPNDSSGATYHGGGNDLNRDIEIAQRCVDAGMKICLDFHYSDFWAHHGQQWKPKSWTSLETSTLISTAASWTTEVLQAFDTAGCRPSMVQVGNETNNNQICGLTGNSSDALNFFKQCCAAVRSFDSSIQIVIHYACDQAPSNLVSYFTSLTSASCDFDVLGLSYYPYWHNAASGYSHEDLDTVLATINNNTTLAQKKICIMEYSYGWTTTWTSWGTQYGQMSNTFNDSLAATGGYAATVEGQATCIYDINKSISSVSNGIGSFYWEPAWISKMNTSWASSNAESYYNDNGENTSDYTWGTNTWSNQALFDYDGKVLDSLKVYNAMWGRDY